MGDVTGRIPADAAISVILGLVQDLRDRDRSIAVNAAESKTLLEVREDWHKRIDALAQEFADRSDTALTGSPQPPGGPSTQE